MAITSLYRYEVICDECGYQKEFTSHICGDITNSNMTEVFTKDLKKICYYNIPVYNYQHNLQVYSTFCEECYYNKFIINKAGNNIENILFPWLYKPYVFRLYDDSKLYGAYLLESFINKNNNNVDIIYIPNIDSVYTINEENITLLDNHVTTAEEIKVHIKNFKYSILQ